MIGFRPLSQLQESADLLASLDFGNAQPDYDLRMLLRVHALFCGKAIIPSVFLLHNRSICKEIAREDARIDLAGFFRSRFACISVPDRIDLHSFSLHRQASLESDNPMVLSEEEGGAHYAKFLDLATSETTAWVSPATAALRGFESRFREAAASAGIPQRLADELIELRHLTAHRVGWEARKEKDRIEGLTRSDLLLLLGKGRSADPDLFARLRREVPKHIISNEPRILEAASAAYCRGIVAGLTLPSQQSVAAGNWWHPSDGLVRLAAPEELIDCFRSSKLLGNDEPVRIDWSRIAAAPWSELENVLSNDAATYYFNRRLQFGDRPNLSTFKDLLDSTAEYLQVLGKTYGTRSTRGFILVHTQLRPGMIAAGLLLCGLSVVDKSFVNIVLAWGVLQVVSARLKALAASQASSSLRKHFRGSAYRQLFRTRYEPIGDFGRQYVRSPAG